MRILFVVQRYGREVAGGAELHCREFATRLAARGHEVEALTSRAVSYETWADHYPEGSEQLDGVTVHRLSVGFPRRPELFDELDGRMTAPAPVPRYLQAEWMRLQGPYLPELADRIRERAGAFDVVVFFTYLYFTSWAGLPAVGGLAPSVLHPTAHDEAPLYLRVHDRTFRAPSALTCSTPEEEDLVRRRFRVRQPAAVVGVGTDVGAGADTAAFRDRHGLGDRPYLLYVGRFDTGKASEELVGYLAAYKERNPGPLALVLVGEPVRTPPPHPDLVVTGFVDEAEKHGAMAGALALVQPSYFESFSMVLVEAWAHGTPALVQGRCAVLDGQVRRAGGGVPYEGFAEFEAAVDLLAGDAALARRLGDAGRRYVEGHYTWDAVMDAYEAHLEHVASSALRS